MNPTLASASEIRRAIKYRASQLEEIAQRLSGPLGHSRPALRDALSLVEQVPDAIRRLVELEWDRNPDPTSKVEILIPLLRHANFVADLTESHLSHGSRFELSEMLVDQVTGELRELGLDSFAVVMAHGPANNFLTKYGDLSAALFRPIAVVATPTPPESLFALFNVPRTEGSGAWWRPVLVGHEVAHVAVAQYKSVELFDIDRRLDLEVAARLDNPVGSGPTAALGLYQIASDWTTELLCDFHALRRFGPAAIAAMAEYFTTIGAMEAVSSTHPPGNLRVRLLLDQLGSVQSSRVRAVVQSWNDLVPNVVAPAEPWASHLAQIFVSTRGELMDTVNALPGVSYGHSGRSGVVEQIADDFARGVPGSELIRSASGEITRPTPADVVNAAWVSRVEDAVTPVDTLAEKALHTIDFVTRWEASGGALPLDLHEISDAPHDDHGSLLGASEIASRLQRVDDRRLVVTPLLHRPKGTALDLRLGNRFIVFRRSSTTTFDPLDRASDPRAVQVYTELGRHQQFVLHPNEMVLGATMEYLVMPDDLAAQVITRSSYGRLGLLSATAVQVHSLFRGCLTLELVNLSTIPLTLTPGQRIAQLVLWHTATSDGSDEKYSCPTGPQFSKVQSDRESEILARIIGPPARSTGDVASAGDAGEGLRSSGRGGT